MLSKKAISTLADQLAAAFTFIRAVAFLSLCAVMILSGISAIAQSRHSQEDGIPPAVGNILNTLSVENEHRFTKLETTMAEVYKEVNDIRTNSWIALLGIFGLAGETGIRLGRRVIMRKNGGGS